MAEFKNQARNVRAEKYKQWLIDHAAEYLLADDVNRDFCRAKWFKQHPTETFPLKDTHEGGQPPIETGPATGASLMDTVVKTETVKTETPAAQPSTEDTEDAKAAAQDTPPDVPPPPFRPEEPTDRPQATTVLTPEQARINALVQQAGDVPVIENVKDLFHTEQAAIPMRIRVARTDLSYRWLDTHDLENSLHNFGGIWEIVTRANHSHLPESYFGMDGAISYKASVLLGFTSRDITDQVNDATVKALSLRIDKSVENKSQVFTGAGGRTLATVERVDDIGDGYGRTALTDGRLKEDGGEYDFVDTGSDGSAE